jgi:metal-dependent amidase/aminoacylase/carboxypeptidase family protein
LTNSLPFGATFTPIPELAFNELRTADMVARELTAYGLEVHRGLATDGRCRRSAQRQQSRRDRLARRHGCAAAAGKERLSALLETRGAMHACGHDGHTTMLLGAARYLAEHRDELDFDGTCISSSSPPRSRREAPR